MPLFYRMNWEWLFIEIDIFQYLDIPSILKLAGTNTHMHVEAMQPKHFLRKIPKKDGLKEEWKGILIKASNLTNRVTTDLAVYQLIHFMSNSSKFVPPLLAMIYYLSAKPKMAKNTFFDEELRILSSCIPYRRFIEVIETKEPRLERYLNDHPHVSFIRICYYRDTYIFMRKKNYLLFVTKEEGYDIYVSSVSFEIT